MQDRSFVPFTEEMKKDYTILVPNMLPIHFKLLLSLFKANGYNVELLETTGPQIAETGLKYTHNDTCYPAILVVGQMMDALLSGKYDLDKTALIMFQTGGGCRASNYISLIRKALKKANMEQVPVISLNFYGMENHPGFKLTPKILHSMIYAVCYGDLIMSLVNQVRPYETNKGEAEALADRWTEKLGIELANEKIRYRKIKNNYKMIIADFAKIPMVKTNRPKVGIVGEIFVKYSPLANNDLERFLIKEGAEVVVPGLIDFCLYAIYNSIMDYKLYGKNKKTYLIWKFAFWLFNKKKNDISKFIREEGTFDGWTEFDKIIDIASGVISLAVKMGEGWLLTSEMVELAESGCANIVCTQPFGCLPNHICGKGMMKPLKEILPDINIVAIDYDAGASRVNQENRLKLMLANARRIAEKEGEKTVTEKKHTVAV
ncbi:MAG: 2-hydroxyacyl-CoA dehydratase [Oscillospiraceae bacterium]|nr:2-hydroxyacyl-CoA dehydratase [Oscillospiraceae bacterium]